MIPLRPALKNYLTMRRALGYKLRRTEKLLAQFITYVEATSSELVTNEVAVAWATLPVGGDESWWAARLSVVRSFTNYLHTLDETTEVPPADLMPARTHRAVPYLYSDDEVLALVAAAAILDFPLRVLTYQTLIPLLAVTGIRIGEAIRLDTKDVDFENGLLTVWLGKFGKSRELPLHPSTLDALWGIYLIPVTATEPSVSGSESPQPVHFHRRHSAALLQCPLDLAPTGPARRSPAALDCLPAADSRPSP